MELQESVALPSPFAIVAGSIAVHLRSAGRGRSERMMVPVKSSMRFTTIVVVAGVVASAGTISETVAPIVKPERGTELNVLEDVTSELEV